MSSYPMPRTQAIRNARERNRRNARIAAFVGDGMACLATCLLIAALVALVPTVFDDTRYALVVTDSAGDAWVMDYDMTYDDCRDERSRYALGVAACEAAKG